MGCGGDVEMLRHIRKSRRINLLVGSQLGVNLNMFRSSTRKGLPKVLVRALISDLSHKGNFTMM